MESFFLAETVKYLYLIFDEHNFIHNDGTRAKVVETTDGPCVIEGIFLEIYHKKFGTEKYNKNPRELGG
jgi:hypothetical protein